MAPRTTIKESVRIQGVGLHSGDVCTIILRPGELGEGVVFHCGGVCVPATADRVVDTGLGTTLGTEGVTIRTIEHLMAALHGLGCHDVCVDVDGPEMPAMDGSAEQFADAICRAGIVEHGIGSEPVRLLAPIRIERGGSEAWAFPWSTLAVTVLVDYPGTVAGRQCYSLNVNADSFRKEVASARTFALEAEYETIKAAGLAKGGGLHNAFLVGPTAYSGELRFPDEVVRHKALDLIGDLLLAGGPVQAHIVAVRPGHGSNVLLAAALHDAVASEVTEDH